MGDREKGIPDFLSDKIFNKTRKALNNALESKVAHDMTAEDARDKIAANEKDDIFVNIFGGTGNQLLHALILKGVIKLPGIKHP